MGVIDFCKKYSPVVGLVGGLLLILNYTGFNPNIYNYYNGLEIEGKLLFVFIVNILVTVLSVILVLSRIKSSSLERTVVKFVSTRKKK